MDDGAEDLLLLAQDYGQSHAAASVVPEPRGLGILFVLAMPVVGGRRRVSRGNRQARHSG